VKKNIPIPPEAAARNEHSQQRMEHFLLRLKIEKKVRSVFDNLLLYEFNGREYQDGGHADVGRDKYEHLSSREMASRVIKAIFPDVVSQFYGCKSCHQLIPEHYSYCPYCGTKKKA
jgi:hypothetical protein